MIYILGAGGCAREVYDIFTDLGKDGEVKGFLEENCNPKRILLDSKFVEDISLLKTIDKTDAKLICAIGTPLRKKLIDYTTELGYDYETVIHPSVIKSKWVTIGKGCIICAGDILTSQIYISDHVILNVGCTIGHDVRIGKYSTVSPGVHVSGNVSIGDECFIGAGTTIIEKISIGKGSFIGAGATVTKNIPENTLAVGTPAKSIRHISEFDWGELI